MNLAELLPEADVVLALEPDELGLRILQVVSHWSEHMQQLELGTFINSAVGPRSSSITPYPAGISHDPKAIEREWSTAAGVQALTGSQIRAARAVLRWSVADLANAAGVSPAVIRHLEEVDSVSSAEAAHEAIEAALHDAGVEFTRGSFGKPGVRPR
jgi:hypothetical protein